MCKGDTARPIHADEDHRDPDAPMAQQLPAPFTPATARRSVGAEELVAEVWYEPRTADEWALREPEQPPDTGYRYRFAPTELEAIKACHDEHGFALVEGVLTPAEVDGLRADIESVCPAAEIADSGSSVRHAFAEFSPCARSLLFNDAYMRIQRQLLGVTAGVDDGELTVHRSAAIVRKPGAGGGGASSAWHSDFTGYSPLPLTNASMHLNRGEAPNGKWFYLNGSHPRKGGLCVVAESHHPEYTPPPGFRWSGGGRERSGLERVDAATGEWISANNDFDIPGCVPLFSNPGDMLVFAARTLREFLHLARQALRCCSRRVTRTVPGRSASRNFGASDCECTRTDAAFPVPADFNDVRHSVAVGLRSTYQLQGDFEGATVDACPWPIPDSAQRAIEVTAGTDLGRYFKQYWGFPGAEPGTEDWTPAGPSDDAHAKL